MQDKNASIKKLFGYLVRPGSDTGSGNRNGKDFTFLVLRHGESLGQIFKGAYRALGDDKIPLTPKGSAQASAAGHIIGRLAQEWNVPFARILCSSGNRASHTAQEIFKKVALYKPGSTLEIAPAIDKQKFGAFDGLFTDAEREAQCGPLYARPPGGESVADVRDRIGMLFDGLRDAPGFYVIVTHGTNTLCIESILTGKDEAWIMDNVDTRGNCQIRMLAGHHETGFTAQDVCRDPLAWRMDLPAP